MVRIVLLGTLALSALGCAGPRPAEPSPSAAELARVERQIEELYGPLLCLVEESRLAIEDVLFHLKRDYVFPTDGPLPEDELRFWLFRAENDLMPRNEEMVALIQAKGSLAEGGKLPPILAALVEHQASWRELHRRWKTEGVKYEWRSKSPFPRDLGAVLSREHAALKKRHGEILKEVPGAEIRHLDRQLMLYEALVLQNRKTQLALSRLAGEFGRPAVFPLKNDQEQTLWLLWCGRFFFPHNEAIRRTIRDGLHLAEGTGMPEGFQAFLDYWNSWRMEHARWKEQGVPYRMHSKRDYPAKEFGEAVERTFQELTSRRVRLLGAAR